LTENVIYKVIALANDIFILSTCTGDCSL